MESTSGRNQARNLGGLAPALLLVALTLAPALRAQPPGLSKEYIRLGGRILAIEVQAPTGNPTFEGWACLSCGISTSGWQVVGAADFDGNGVPDLVYQNTSTYQINVDYYGGPGGATFIGWACLSCSVPGGTAGWQVVAVADFNRDGVPDLVYQNQQTNQVNVNYFGGGGGALFQAGPC